VREQVEEYEASNGERANTLRDTGLPVVIVTTRGRKSGKIRKFPLMRVEHGGEYALVASLGGAPKNPTWYGNLIADPLVTLQDGPVVQDYTAREAHGDEKAEWWARAIEVWPAYDDYQAKTERIIPLVLLEPR
jgi:F420H(2)-dependent quinone reductase